MRLQVGETVSVKHTLTQEDFDRFAKLSGDDNPIHVDPEFSARTRFGKTVAHGMYLYSLICGALNSYLPGAVQLSQDLMFPYPSPVGDEVTITLHVLEAQPGEARIETRVTRSDGEVGCQGEMRVAVPEQ